MAWERDLLPFLNGPAASREAERERLRAAVREGLDRIIVAEVNGVAVGWCQRMRGRAYIPFLFVTPLLQNHGVGSALLRRMESLLELEGADRIQLDTLADNVRAVNFYQHQGYQILALRTRRPARPGVADERQARKAPRSLARPHRRYRINMTLIDTRTPNPKSFIKGQTGDWEVIIGMEVHAQVTSESKLFSGSSTEFGRPANSNVSFVDAAMPGMLPVINEECVRQAVRTGLGLKAQINKRSIFDRKNYFYPDLPQGYQISQFKDPIVGEGKVLLDMPEGQIEIGIERLHLEQDAGKSIHDQHPNMSFVDLNRSGVALMEIVSKPDLRSSEEAKEYLSKLRTILRYLGTCDGNMEQGSMRADVNVSVRTPRRRIRHALRDQERQLDPLCRPGHRIRGAPPDRHSRGWRHHRPGNPPVRPQERRDALDALEGRGA